MRSFTAVFVLGTLTFLFFQVPAHAQWSLAQVYWGQVTSQGNDAHTSPGGEVSTYSELPTAMTPNDTDSITAQAEADYVWQGSGSGSSQIRFDITGYVWGLAQGLYLNGSGSAESKVLGYPYPIAYGYCGLNQNYGPPNGVQQFNLPTGGGTIFTVTTEVSARTNLFHGSMGGGTAAANAVARATYSQPY